MQARTDTLFDFDPIVEQYDLGNHLFSFGMDRHWRKIAVQTLRPTAEQCVLDICCGTGDMAFAFLDHSPIRNLTGLDISPAMIAHAQKKQDRRRNRKSGEVIWEISSAVKTGLPVSSYDLITCAFGLRNIADRHAVLCEIRRLLRPGGCAAILDFSLPGNPLLRRLYRVYLHRFMPFAGRLLYGHSAPLHYLGRSIEAWATRFDLPRTAAAAGLNHKATRQISGGIVTLNTLQKPVQTKRAET